LLLLLLLLLFSLLLYWLDWDVGGWWDVLPLLVMHAVIIRTQVAHMVDVGWFGEFSLV
jgi:hypothetical protein